jgi:hypothetical protein
VGRRNTKLEPAWLLAREAEEIAAGHAGAR